MNTPFTKSSGYMKSVIDAAEKVMKEASNEAPTINHLELSEEPAKKADDTPPFDPDPPREKRPDEPKTAKGLARAAMIKQIRDKAMAEKKRLRKSLREEESEQIDETLKAIVTRKNKDGSYDEVGTSNRTVVQGTHSVVKRKAREWAKGAHRIELHYPSKFYKEPHKTIHVSEESEQVSEREMTDAEKAKKEKYVKSMKPVSDWEKRYPGRGKEVMYAVATKQAMKEEIEVKEQSQASKIKKMVKGKTETTKGGKTMTGKPCDQVNVNPVHTDGIMSGTNTQSGVQ